MFLFSGRSMTYLSLYFASYLFPIASFTLRPCNDSPEVWRKVGLSSFACGLRFFAAAAAPSCRRVLLRFPGAAFSPAVSHRVSCAAPRWFFLPRRIFLSGFPRRLIPPSAFPGGLTRGGASSRRLFPDAFLVGFHPWLFSAAVQGGISWRPHAARRTVFYA